MSLGDYQREYDELEHALAEQAVGTRLCSDCQAANVLDLFKPFESCARPPHPRKLLRFESTTDLATRNSCPICRFLWRAIRDGNKNCCAASCQPVIQTLQDGQSILRDSTSTKEQLQIELWLPQYSETGWIHTRINGQNVNRHISFGRTQFVHPKFADHQRINAWLKTCRQTHQSCNEHQPTSSSSLHGLSLSSLRLIDVESRLMVQTLHCVPFVTFSYVWGEAASRTFEEKALEAESYHVSDNIRPMDRQPIALLEGNLPQTFEDAISFTKRLGERYIWIDALCIPQDEPDIKAQQISQMDQIYSSSICTIVSLESGVEGGLPGSSSQSPRNVDQYFELLPGGLKIASPLMSLRLTMEEAAWETRAWTMQEHLLSRRTLFFVEFVHAMPIDKENLLKALLWRHSSMNPTLMRDLNSSSSTLRQWPHWAWLSHPGGVAYDPFVYWSHLRSYAKHLELPQPKAWYQGPNGQFCSLTTKGPSVEGVWRNPDFSTARGSISFHMRMVVDDQRDGKFSLPEGTQYIRLLRLNPKDRPRIPRALDWDRPHQVLKSQATLHDSSQHVVTTDESGPRAETEFSSALDWISRSDRLDDVEADSALLVVGVTPPGIVTRRLGIAYVRMMDFLVVGAVVKEVLLGD
ncbi:heterokaryon incompatibility 6 OR allele [Fusarium pseudocircinatum]|uniref:Heterokaryon incompatibility 6 OR allele n=1 Tax=Fusarium pseudocircinatum TaxID=56676 RepID=A0A8H5P0S9_9HYPO|nr:heterokaryon incompatibility 6 OR allele [Fusarium pseudocircinatum]